MRLSSDDADQRPVVTIAALYGAGGSVVGPRVAERLGVPFLDRAIPTALARRVGLIEHAVAAVDDAPRSVWNRWMGTLGRASPATAATAQPERLDLDERRLRAEIEEFLGAAGRSGGVVLGRGGAVVLANVPGALHVFLGGDKRARIRRVMDLRGLDRETASHRVKVNDRARREYVRNAYGIDGDNPSLYHLTLDAIALGVEPCVELIVDASRARGVRATVERPDAQAS